MSPKSTAQPVVERIAFELRAEVMRLGSRVASTRMEFLGADGKLLSTGAGAYIVS
jgi:acyl-coenzyme A thioesterase PaaI-like protein